MEKNDAIFTLQEIIMRFFRLAFELYPPIFWREILNVWQAFPAKLALCRLCGSLVIDVQSQKVAIDGHLAIIGTVTLGM